MTSIDKIMGAIGRHGDDCIRDADAASESFDGLRELIAAALADARREGAEAMRTQLAILTPEMASAACWRHTVQSAGDYARAVSASPLPLPTGSQPAGAVPGEWIKWQGGECPISDGVRHQVKLRDGYLSSDDLEARSWVGWDHIDGESDIVAYRVLA